ncbi:ROK family protein [Kineococcus sp. R8]|uniref:ROK family protein n=1 Tax=Kineococcus siccus TaxID=2696567 RepID=UPI001411DB92|nr:ROK family protein [Kineococcus siccus]NAZ82409.1 ROK family protein [Kineococcus siccus]
MTTSPPAAVGTVPPAQRPGVAWTPLTGAAHRIAVAVLLDGPLPRSELARRFDLSAGSLTRLSRPLLDSGMLVETTGVYDATSGRPTRPLDVDETSHHFVGVKLTATTAHAVLTTLRARVVAAEEALLLDTSPAGVAATVAALVRSLAAHADRGSGGGPVRAVGVSLGGRVGERGTVRSARYLGWDGVPLGEPLEDLLGLPVVVDNDLLSLTRAEQWFGAARGCDHFAVLTIGEGVGYGLVVHDEVVDAPDAGVGLLGHFPLDPTGPLCPQGHAGCADGLLTIGAVTSRAAVGLRREVRYEEVLDLAVEGDPVARRVVDDAARGLGRLTAAVGNLTMPRKVILSGDGIRLAEVGRAALLEQVAADRNPHASELVIDVQRTGFREWARGAAITAIRTFVLGTRA